MSIIHKPQKVKIALTLGVIAYRQSTQRDTNPVFYPGSCALNLHFEAWSVYPNPNQQLASFLYLAWFQRQLRHVGKQNHWGRIPQFGHTECLHYQL